MLLKIVVCACHILVHLGSTILGIVKNVSLSGQQLAPMVITMTIICSAVFQTTDPALTVITGTTPEVSVFATKDYVDTMSTGILYLIDAYAIINIALPDMSGIVTLNDVFVKIVNAFVLLVGTGVM